MISTTLAIIGIFLTLIFGIYSVYSYLKSKKNVSLVFQNKECYSLFQKDVNLLNIDLSYNNKSITNPLILLKARLVNTGRTDMDKNRIHDPLKIICKAEYKFLEANITTNKPGVRTDIEVIHDRKIQLNWDLLKQDEFIEIEALIEVEKSNYTFEDMGAAFYESLTFDFRITDLNVIRLENTTQPLTSLDEEAESMRKTFRSTALFVFFMGLCFLVSALVPRFNFIKNKSVYYDLVKDNEEIVARISSVGQKYILMDFEEAGAPLENIYLHIQGRDVPLELPVSKFNSEYKIKKLTDISMGDSIDKNEITFGLLQIFLGLSLLYLVRKKVKKIPSSITKIN